MTATEEFAAIVARAEGGTRYDVESVVAADLDRRALLGLVRDIMRWLVDAAGYPLNVAYCDNGVPDLPPDAIWRPLAEAWHASDTTDGHDETVEDYEEMIREEAGA